LYIVGVWLGGTMVYPNEHKFLPNLSTHDVDMEHEFIHLVDTPTTYSGSAQKIVVVNDTEDGLEFITTSGIGVSDEEKFCWQIKLAKLRPSLIQEATVNFTPSGYDVYPVVAHNWRAGITAEFEHGPIYPQTIVIKSGTPINFESDGIMLYVKSIDVHSVSDSVQNDNPKMEYFKRLKYIQTNNYMYKTAWMAAGAWNTQTITPGTYGSLLIQYTFNNIREFTIFNNAATKHIYHGNLQTNGTSTLGFSRHEDKFFIPVRYAIKIDVRAAGSPAGGGVYTVKYIDVPEWW